MQTLIRRGVLALALVLGVSACTPQQMAAWLQDTGRPVPDDPAALQAQADVATAYWDAVVASLNAPPPGPSSSGGWPWGALVQCEAGGNWAANTGNGYSGGLQFVHSTWAAYGGQAYAPQAWQATAGQQIEVAQRIVASHGGSYRAWPGCRAKLGLP